MRFAFIFHRGGYRNVVGGMAAQRVGRLSLGLMLIQNRDVMAAWAGNYAIFKYNPQLRRKASLAQSVFQFVLYIRRNN